MDISTYWDILNDRMFFDDKLVYEIIKWVYDNKNINILLSARIATSKEFIIINQTDYKHEENRRN